jgi:hypothetical protein
MISATALRPAFGKNLAKIFSEFLPFFPSGLLLPAGALLAVFI